MEHRLPQAQQQRCITHKVRGMERYLSFEHLPVQDAQGQALEPTQAKEARRTEVFQEAYAIYEAPTLEAAQLNLAAFIEQWRPLEPKAVHAFCWGIGEPVAPQLTVVMLPLPFPVVVSAWVDVLGVWVQPKGAGGP